MKKELIYITYQTFPANTANSIQTISTLKYFFRHGLKTTLIFPLRNKESSSEVTDLKNHYLFNEDIQVKGTIHPLPFKKFLFLERFTYLISHFFWSYFTVRKYSKIYINKQFFTRSEWVFYFLSNKNKDVVYECHQLSKLKIYLVNKALEKPNSKVITLTSYLKKELDNKYTKKIEIIGSSYDNDFFQNSNNKSSTFVYAGSVHRFGDSRGLNIITNKLDSLSNKNLKFIIISSKNENLDEFKHLFQKNNPTIEIEIFYELSQEKVGQILSTSSVGLLINNKSKHSEFYSSPLKYFEYLASGLNVVATNLDSHKNLPFQNKIIFYDYDDVVSFQDAIIQSIKLDTSVENDIYLYSMENRVKKIINLFTS
tara:strand:- start:5645 stop:6751 length:1107 start_codon:yes stop_codon:yes gene_type:complete